MKAMQRKMMKVQEASGWYLAENAIRMWTEDFIDQDTGEVVPIDRSEIIAPIGELLNVITISMLEANGITDVLVSDKQIIGRQAKFLSLWQLECVTLGINGKLISRYYIIPKGSPLEVEEFFKEWADINIDGNYTIKKVAPLNFSIVTTPFDEEIVEAESKRISIYFYKVVTKNIEGQLTNILIRADSVNTAQSQINSKYISEDFGDRIVNVKELNIEQLFEEGVSVTKYTLASYRSDIKS